MGMEGHNFNPKAEREARESQRKSLDALTETIGLERYGELLKIAGERDLTEEEKSELREAAGGMNKTMQ